MQYIPAAGSADGQACVQVFFIRAGKLIGQKLDGSSDRALVEMATHLPRTPAQFLNLNGVGDEEVLKLYSAVLDEIAQIQIADQERLYPHYSDKLWPHGPQLNANRDFAELATNWLLDRSELLDGVGSRVLVVLAE